MGKCGDLNVFNTALFGESERMLIKPVDYVNSVYEINF